MKILVLDTETTGLPPKGPLCTETWPHVVQCSFIAVDTDSNKHTEYDYIVAVKVDLGDSTKIHGITPSLNRERGMSFPDVYAILKVCLDTCDMVVGHNLSFDLNMIRVECLRHSLDYQDPELPYCTMKGTKGLCNLLGPSGFVKYPKLQELYVKLFGCEAKHLHNALADCYACLCCFYRVVLKRDPPSKFRKNLT